MATATDWAVKHDDDATKAKGVFSAHANLRTGSGKFARDAADNCHTRDGEFSIPGRTIKLMVSAGRSPGYGSDD